jgi:MinD-like ATPase involved in chromosome partitioning or flagellar assembly
MVMTISIHSHKGGTGKTMISVNLAAVLVQRGYNVAVIDLDLGAPSLQTYAPNRSDPTLNEFFLQERDITDVIFDASYLLPKDTKNKLYFALASLDTEKISAMEQRDKHKQLNDLYLLMGIVRNKLPNNPWNVDFIIIDTSPGMSTSSINSVAASNHLMVIFKLINGDLEGTGELVKTLHGSLNLDTSLVLNQVPSSFVNYGGYEKTISLIEQKIIAPISNNKNISFGGIILTDLSVLERETEFAINDLAGDHKPRPIQAITNINSEFTKSIHKIADHMLKKKSSTD